MTKTHLGFLMALLGTTPILYAACGGDSTASPTAGTTTGTAGSGVGGSGGATTGTGGAAGGTAGKDGGGGSSDASSTRDVVLVDGRLPCGTVMNGCTASPTGTNICDEPNNRCVQCLSTPDCAAQPTNKICDTTANMMGLPADRCVQCASNTDCAGQAVNKTCDLRVSTQTGLPAARCVACLDNTQCPTGATCTNSTCYLPCGTVTNGCTTNPTGNDICDLPNNRCVDCKSDTDCAVETTAKHCDTSLNPQGLPWNSCEDCLTDAHCPSGQVCNNNTCTPSCTTDAQCATDGGGGGGPQAPYCHPTTKVCAECTNNTHCATQMGAPFCATDGSCVECLSDADCASQPTSPFCRLTDFSCVTCRTSADCPNGGTCNVNRGTCSNPEAGTPEGGPMVPDAPRPDTGTNG